MSQCKYPLCLGGGEEGNFCTRSRVDDRGLTGDDTGLIGDDTELIGDDKGPTGDDTGLRE